MIIGIGIIIIISSSSIVVYMLVYLHTYVYIYIYIHDTYIYIYIYTETMWAKTMLADLRERAGASARAAPPGKYHRNSLKHRTEYTHSAFGNSKTSTWRLGQWYANVCSIRQN